MITAILEIVKNITDFLNRETAADEKTKKTAVQLSKERKKAIFFARQIFDGYKDFVGLDTLLLDKLEEKDYNEYLKLRKKFNKYS